MDVVALAQFGVGYAVATLGTATTPMHVQKLLPLSRRGRVLLRRRRRRAQGRVARARSEPADRRPTASAIRFLFLPRGRGPGQLRARARARRRSRRSSTRLPLSRIPAGGAEAEVESRKRPRDGPASLAGGTAATFSGSPRPSLRIQLLEGRSRAWAGAAQDEATRSVGVQPTAAYGAVVRLRQRATSGAGRRPAEWKLLSRGRGATRGSWRGST